MTSRIIALTVVLEEPIREDDAQAIIAAIQTIRGVLEVVPQVADANQYSAYTRAKIEIAQKLFEILK